MAKARTTTATAVEEPIVEQNIETTPVVEEPQTPAEGGNNETTTEGTPTDNGENTTQTTPEDSNNETTTEGTGEGIIEGDDNGDGTPQTPTEGDIDGDNDEPNNDAPVENPLVGKFVEMSGINRPYAEGIMELPNADYYLPVGSGIDLSKRTDLINEINAANNPSTEGE